MLAHRSWSEQQNPQACEANDSEQVDTYVIVTAYSGSKQPVSFILVLFTPLRAMLPTDMYAALQCASHQSLGGVVSPSIGVDLLAIAVDKLIVSVDEDIKVLLSELQDRVPIVVQGLGVLDLVLCVYMGILWVDGHPRLHICSSESAIGRCRPLHWCAAIVARFLLVFLSSNLLCLGIEFLGFQ